MSQEPVSLSDIDPTLSEQPAERFEYDDVPIFTSEGLKAQQDRYDPNEGADGESKSKTKKKQKPLVRGSTADYKRKEANRLAAERSRNRQNEKRAGLNEAVQRLRTEQARLKAEIAKLDGTGEGEGGLNTFDLPRDESSHRGEESAPVGTGAISGSEPAVGNEQGQATGNAGPGMTNEALDAEAEAQAHSRTILAALMSDAEIDQALVGEWMDQVGHGNEESGPSNLNNATPTSIEPPAGATLQSHSQVQTPAQSDAGPTIQGRVRSSTRDEEDGSIESEMIKPNGIAVALHAEMERYLREDLAITKIAIDQIDKEFAILRGELERPTGQDGNLVEYVSPLPAQASSADLNVLSAIVDSVEEECRQVGNTLPGLKEILIGLKESRIAEAEGLKTSMSNLNISDDDRTIVDKLLRSLILHLDELLMGLAPEKADALHTILGSSLAPAIAPRRRGRPPRHPAIAKKRVPRNRKSQLANVIVIEDSAESELNQDQGEVDGHHDENSNLDPRLDERQGQAVEQGQDEGQGQSTELALHNLSESQGEMTTEELISQLANHDDQDLRDLLSSHAENEYAAQQAISAHLQSQLDQQPNPLDNPVHHHHHHHQTLGHDHEHEHDQGEGSASTSHVVSFKQGPAGSCDICTRTQTTVWRKLHVNGEDLHVCNPCGMYHIKTGQIRPPELWGDGKLIRKRRKSTHPRTLRDQDLEHSGDLDLEHEHEHDEKRFKGASEGLGEEGSDRDAGGEGDQTQMEVENLGEVGHDEFRATLGIEGISEIMKEFGDGVGVVGGDVEQDVAHVFGTVE